jgi:hypothetical protein
MEQQISDLTQEVGRLTGMVEGLQQRLSAIEEKIGFLLLRNPCKDCVPTKVFAWIGGKAGWILCTGLVAAVLIIEFVLKVWGKK